MGKTIAQYQTKCHDNAMEKGFWDESQNIAEKIMLIVTELAEAVEADRKGRHSKVLNPNVLGLLKDIEGDFAREQFQEGFEGTVKGTFEDEMADVAIRLFDLCEFLGIDLEYHIQLKMKYNSR